MISDVADVSREVADLRAYLDTTGSVFAVFDQQDSGCVSYGVSTRSGRWFVKTAAEPSAVASIERAVALHEAIQHPVIVPLHHRFTAMGRPVLVHPWRDGEVLYHPTTARAGGRTDPTSAMARFRASPVPVVETALDQILDAHVAVGLAGFVASDLYDGCFIYDFAAGKMSLVDLDEYRPGSLRRARAAERLTEVPGARGADRRHDRYPDDRLHPRADAGAAARCRGRGAGMARNAAAAGCGRAGHPARASRALRDGGRADRGLAGRDPHRALAR